MNPKKPTLLYDQNCSFCQDCVDYLKSRTKNKVDYLPYQKSTFGRPLSDCKKNIQLVMPDNQFYQGAAAGLKAMSYNPYSHGWLLYKRLPGFAWIAEKTYRWITRHKSLCHKILKLLYPKLR